MRVRLLLAGLLCAPLVLSGCVTGYNSVLMATKTNVGVDIQASPPTVDISVGRKEGTIQPVFEGGQTLPVMASVRGKTTTNGDLVLGGGQAFAGGEAAYVMSELFNEKTPDGNTATCKDGHKVFLTKKPKFRDGKITFVEPGSVKPMVFATDSAFGLKVSANQLTPAIPASIKFGFNRSEAVFSPVGLRPATPCEKQCHPGATWVAEIPSVLATIDYSASATPGKTDKDKDDKKDAKASGSMFGTETGLVQFFAAGPAATSLSRRQEVRNAMAQRLDPVADFIDTIRAFAASECSQDVLNMRQAHENLGQLEKFNNSLTAWIRQNCPGTSIEKFLYHPELESERCKFAATF